MVDEDFTRVDDSGDDRDVAGGNAAGVLEDEDRTHSRHLAALVLPARLVPPAAGIAEQSDTRHPACVKHAISGSARFGRSHHTRSKTRTRKEAVRHQRSH